MSRNQVLAGTVTDYVLFMQDWLLKTLFGDRKSKKGILIVISDVLVTAIAIGVPSILFVPWKTLGLRKWRKSGSGLKLGVSQNIPLNNPFHD